MPLKSIQMWKFTEAPEELRSLAGHSPSHAGSDEWVFVIPDPGQQIKVKKKANQWDEPEYHIENIDPMLQAAINRVDTMGDPIWKRTNFDGEEVVVCITGRLA
jgi:hypothetical protein